MAGNSKIKILPQALSNKIAAGEVVNRPESAVKELIENSIDAGADKITLLIKDAGKSLIQVIDNGPGMSEDDAILAFQRHSTSKIETYNDLENIKTLGFRGEALASICSISQIELKTKTEDDEVGTLLKIDGSEIVQVSKLQTDRGTSIAVKNLFFNTPARRNFLKSNQTEFRHIYETFIRLAISHPEIAFELINGDEEIFSLKAGSLKERLSNLFTSKFAESLIEVNHGNNIVNITGYISKPGFTKRSKQDQYFYLNNRYFGSKSLNFAVYTGYGDLIEKGDYPSFFLFITIDQRKVDVNVHPSKMEVKFENESAIFGMIVNAVKEALRKNDLTFDVKFQNDLGFQGEFSGLQHSDYRKPASAPTNLSRISFPKDKFSTGFSKTKSTSEVHTILDITDQIKDKEENTSLDDSKTNKFEHKNLTEDDKFNVWQFKLKYIMCQTEAGLMIIDQHAAHERILYERALIWLESQSPFSQQLLYPINVELTKIDYQIALSLEKEISNLGFNIKFRDNGIVEILGLPSDVRIGNETKIFQELIDQYKEYELKLNLEKRDNLAASFACRSAIKTGDRLKDKEMISLIDELFAAKMPYVCPHGRPTIIRITTEELDKRFSRT
ncbi:MAG: DNA mismatch repair endonuclease MutL [Ignavibacteriaceae bacterium]|nr:MAG: DNA mismatch repair endonuclease MutL [Chlorobiota bacterium]MBV6399389.1 DNA mismatch repair protein MutL [Ignavibacteria bacterium]MCC6886858.1 DNA mismatch repair endonuclease MutL [Ignavibacteriales bacterium]MCE7953913.1 DNA mismatch repair endonuclease MutL [Chlorobi bacterium CHB7]MDL1887846.1 DNA mismatch repair endonuclease MutL [Ignavibacteria bacterium CHB1]MEB2330523.1 DNA mismatch repair endonuclease MutL [Ignavibacteriaceae bacterium]RIK47933.1 MAG: DNA mismatch repair e